MKLEIFVFFLFSSLDISQFCPLKKLTKENYKITIIRFHKCDSSVYDSVDVIKTALMMFDANYTTYDNGDGLVEGEIFVLDVVGFSFKQFLDLSKNVKTLLAYTKFLQEAAPVRLISNHITNTSAILDGVMGLIKPILSKEISEVVHFHKYGGDSMLNFFDKDVLPIDYGGTNGTIDEHYKEWLKEFETKRFVHLMNYQRLRLPDSSFFCFVLISFSQRLLAQR